MTHAEELWERGRLCSIRARQCRNPAYRSYWEEQGEILLERASGALKMDAKDFVEMMRGRHAGEGTSNSKDPKDLDAYYDKIEESYGSLPVSGAEQNGPRLERSSILGHPGAFGGGSASAAQTYWLTAIGGQWPR